VTAGRPVSRVFWINERELTLDKFTRRGFIGRVGMPPLAGGAAMAADAANYCMKRTIRTPMPHVDPELAAALRNFRRVGKRPVAGIWRRGRGDANSSSV